MVVLTTKSNHKNIAWYEHIWHLCGSYHLLIHITKSTRPFAYPIYQHDNTISNISPRTRFYLPTDQDSGYWQIFLEITSCAKLPSCTNNYSWHLCFYSCCWQHTIVCRRPRHNKLTLNVPLTYYYLLCKIVLLHQQLFMAPMFLKLLLTTYYCMQKTQTPYWPDLNVPLEYYYNTKFLLNLRNINSFAPSWNLGICWSWAHTQWQHTC